MAQIPDLIVDKTAKFFRNAAATVGVISGLFAWGAFHAGNVGPGLLFALVAGGALYGAASIKTTYRLKGGRAVYE